MCENCKKNNVKLPCFNCASDNNWLWNNKRCFGYSENNKNLELTAIEITLFYFNDIRNRKAVIEDANEKKISIDDWCLKYLPYESIEYYKILLEIHNNL